MRLDHLLSKESKSFPSREGDSQVEAFASWIVETVTRLVGVFLIVTRLQRSFRPLFRSEGALLDALALGGGVLAPEVGLPAERLLITA